MNTKENPNNQKPDPNSVRRQRARVKEQLQANAVSKEIIQRCPYTCVIVHTSYEGTPAEGIGFAKVTWPDPFVEEKGIALATEKAYAHLAKDIVANTNRGFINRDGKPTPEIAY